LIKRDNVRVCVPRYLQIGKGSLNELPEIINILGSIKSLLIVTDKQMVSFGYVKKLQEVLTKAGLKSDVFDDTVPDPTDTVVLNGIKFLEECKNDAVIGFGGGSPIDTAKAIAAMANIVKIFKIISHHQCLTKKVYQLLQYPQQRERVQR
jgi:alcohol dehydrogenase class IV